MISAIIFAMEVRQGATRLVILTKNYAFKFPNPMHSWNNFLCGLLGNIQEITFSKCKDFKEQLCPITFYIPGGWLVIMPRCYPANYVPEKVLPFVENKMDSFGIYNDRVVAVDYG